MAPKPETTEVVLQATLRRLAPWALVAFAFGFSIFIFSRFITQKRALHVCEGDLVENRDRPKGNATPCPDIKPASGEDDAFLEKLKHELDAPGLEIGTVRDHLTITFYDPTLFNPGESDLTEQGEEVLRRVGELLRSRTSRLFVVASHLDDAPISPTLRELYPTAWELSAARAINVVRFLVEESNLPPSTLMLGGFGASRPLGANATAIGRARNRRLEISIVSDSYRVPPDAEPPAVRPRAPEPSRESPPPRAQPKSRRRKR